MGLATIDPHSLKERIEICKIPKFGVNRPNSKQDTAIQKCQNLQRNVWLAGQLSIHTAGTLQISLPSGLSRQARARQTLTFQPLP